MKTILILFCVVFGLQTNAQEYYKKEIIETSIFDSTKVSALKYDLQFVDKPSFQKLWKKEMSKNSDGELEANELQTKMTGVSIPSVSKEPYTTYLNLKTTEGGVELIFALKDSVQFVDLNTSPHLKDIEAYFEGFILESYLDKLNDKLKDETATLDDIGDDIKKNYKEIAKNDKSILKLESEIENTQKQIEINATQYDVLLETIEESKRELATTKKDDVAYKEIKKEVKSLQRNKKTMESDKVKNRELIYDNEAKIEATKSTIVDLQAGIAALEERKDAQKKIILALEEEIYSLSKP